MPADGPLGRMAAPRGGRERAIVNLIAPPPRQRKTTLTPQKRPSLTAFNFLVVMAVESMLRRANGAQAGIQRLHDQALVGAERSRVGIRLGLPALNKPDDDTGRRSGGQSSCLNNSAKSWQNDGKSIGQQLWSVNATSIWPFSCLEIDNLAFVSCGVTVSTRFSWEGWNVIDIRRPPSTLSILIDGRGRNTAKSDLFIEPVSKSNERQSQVWIRLTSRTNFWLKPVGGAFACWHSAWPSCLEQAG